MVITQKHTRKPFVVDDENDLPAITRAYAYYARQNPLWLVNIPGQDNKALRTQYRETCAALQYVITSTAQTRAA